MVGSSSIESLAHRHTHIHTHTCSLSNLRCLKSDDFCGLFWWVFVFSSFISLGVFFAGNFHCDVIFSNVLKSFFFASNFSFLHFDLWVFTPTTCLLYVWILGSFKEQLNSIFADFGIQLWGWDVGMRPKFYLVLLQMGEVSKDWSIR